MLQKKEKKRILAAREKIVLSLMKIFFSWRHGSFVWDARGGYGHILVRYSHRANFLIGEKTA